MKAVVVLLLLTALSAGGCSSSQRGISVRTEDVIADCCRAVGDEPVSFRYLGAAGWLVRRGSAGVMTAPFFSNPSLVRAVTLPLYPHRDRVQRHLDLAGGLGDVRVVLAGHAHYDHLLDLPVVFERLPSEAVLYGGTSVRHLLDHVIPGRVVDVVAVAETIHRKGRWVAAAEGVRVLPLLSEHAPHLPGGLKFFRGRVEQPQEHLPRMAWGWREGEPLAFLIDFLRPDGSIDFRVYYNDSAHGSPHGFPHPDTLAENGHRVDVAILCVASFARVSRYPEDLLTYLRPRHVLLGHWEDFFASPDAPGRPVPLTNVAEFIRRVEASVPEGTTWSLLDRHVTVTFASPGASRP